MSSSRGSSQSRDQTQSLRFPALAVGFFTTSAIWEAHIYVYIFIFTNVHKLQEWYVSPDKGHKRRFGGKRFLFAFRTFVIFLNQISDYPFVSPSTSNASHPRNVSKLCNYDITRGHKFPMPLFL